LKNASVTATTSASKSKSDPTALSLSITSLYPTLYRLESKGMIEGRWVEKAGQRRRRYYRLTPGGRGTLVRQRSIWQNFAKAINRVAGIKHA
jgi:PadR family transcriptional regulator, regulatory protein PadR